MWRGYRQKMNWAYFVLSQSRKQQYVQRGTVWLYIKENFPNNLILSTGKWTASGEHASLFLEVFKWRWAPSERVCQETLKASQGRWSLLFLLRVYESKPLSQRFPDYSPHGWSFPCVKLVSINCPISSTLSLSTVVESHWHISRFSLVITFLGVGDHILHFYKPPCLALSLLMRVG